MGVQPQLFFGVCILLGAAFALETTAEAPDSPQQGGGAGCGGCQGTCHEEIGRCDCPRGYSGDCSQAPPNLTKACKKYSFHVATQNCSFDAPSNHCVNGCNKRGTCLAGWCRCEKGFFGADCALSLGSNGKPQLLAGLGYEVRKRKPHIYIYELPPSYNTWFNIRVQDRPLWFMFYQRLLSSGVRTADGDAADYFFLPMNIRGPTESMALVRAIAYVRQRWPWWDRFQGARHLILHTGDVGRMDAADQARKLGVNSTWLTHWGLYQDYPYSGWKRSHRPGQDIVLPILIGSLSPRANAFKHSPLHPLHPDRKNPQTMRKDIEVLFAGRICGGREEPDSSKWPNCRPINVGYSQGVRQLVHYHHWNRTGFKINVSNPRYLQDLAHTRFCLAPTGGGHGHRQLLVSFSGCVPLLIGDYVYQPFEPELDWSRFSVTLPQAAIPTMHKDLAAISNEQYQKLQVALRCGAEHMTFSSFIGSFKWDYGRYDAFETTMEILRSRLLHPGVPPEELPRLDPELKAFMECRDPDQAVQEEPREMPRVLCSQSTLDSEPPSCQKCVDRFNGIIPGDSANCFKQLRDDGEGAPLGPEEILTSINHFSFIKDRSVPHHGNPRHICSSLQACIYS